VGGRILIVCNSVISGLPQSRSWVPFGEGHRNVFLVGEAVHRCGPQENTSSGRDSRYAHCDVSGGKKLTRNNIVRFEVSTAVTMKNVVFWDIKTQFVLHRRHITSPLQSPAG
jgi:hypothetical protein